MSILKRLFGTSTTSDSGTFTNPVTTEMHSHLIPGIDDGVETLEQSIAVLRGMYELGYKKVITTPHIMGDFYKNGKHNILPGLDLVRNELQKLSIPLEVEAAAEYMVDDSLMQKIKDKDILTFGKDCVLIELPFQHQSPNFQEILFELQMSGYQPVLAHPERYPYMAAQKDRYRQLAESGIYLQLNLFSMVGYYSPDVKKAADFLIKERLISLVGSDTHGPRHLPVLAQAIRSRSYKTLCETTKLINNSL